MGSSCSCVSSAADQTKTIEENIFDILPRDPEGPDDIFKPLDVHFARSHTLANLLQLYPSRQLPPEVVGCIWRHYFEYFLVPDTEPEPAPPPQQHQHQQQLQANAVVTPPSPGQQPAIHPVAPMSPSYSGVSAVPPVLADPSAPPSDRADLTARQRILDRSPSFGNSSATASKIGNQHQLHSQPPVPSATAAAAASASPGAAAGASEEVENRSEIACMQRFLTDILRHDLACLKERYDEVLAASLAMPPDTGGGHDHDGGGAQGGGRQTGFAFNPAPVLASVKVDIKRLNNMPIDYLARVVLREMKGLGEDEIPAPVAAPHHRPRLSTSLHPTLNSPQHAPPQPQVPDTPVAGGSSSARSALHLFTPRLYPPAPPALLSQPVFAAHVDIAFRNLFDRYYRKGFWILFTLNVSHHARKVLLAAGDTAGLMMHSAAPGVGGGSSGRSGGSTWSDRIGAAVAGVEQQPLVAVKMRKSSLSSHAGGGGGGSGSGGLGATGQPAPHSPPAGSTFGSPHFSPSSRTPSATPTHGAFNAAQQQQQPQHPQHGSSSSSSSSRPGSSDAAASSPSASGKVGLGPGTGSISGGGGGGAALTGLRLHRSSHSRNSGLAPILEPHASPPPPPPLATPAVSGLESPTSSSGSGGVKSSFKLPPLLVIRSDNAAAPLPSAHPLVVPIHNTSASHGPGLSPSSSSATAAAVGGPSLSNPPSPAGGGGLAPPSLPSPSNGPFKRSRQPSTGGSLMPVQEVV